MINQIQRGALNGKKEESKEKEIKLI